MQSTTSLAPESYQRLLNIAQRITAENNILSLCSLILEESMQITCADAGTLYLVKHEEEHPYLQFMLARNNSLGIDESLDTERTIGRRVSLFDDLGTANQGNIASSVYHSREVVNLENIDEAGEFDFSGTRKFDKANDYHSQSFLCVPLVNDRNEVIGVIQLINAQSEEGGDKGAIVPFAKALEPEVTYLAGFAAIALDNFLQGERRKELLSTLSSESNTGRMLEKILAEAQHITHADGGTIYLLEEGDNGPQLKFALMVNKSLDVFSGGFSGEVIDLPPVPLYRENGEENHNNIVTYAALVKKTLRVEDAYNTEQFDFSGTRGFDKKFKYRSTSFLTVPLLNHDEDVIGVMQLLNATDPASGEVVAFSKTSVALINGLAAYAAIALNNQLLVRDLKNLLDAFIQCIAQAIDAKSSHTSAHCQRIPLLMELIAEAACEDEGVFSDFDLDDDEWYELRVASWLHDCGKLATPDSVLDKSTKLHLMLDGIETVKARFAAAKQSLQKDYYKDLALAQNPEMTTELKQELDAQLATLDEELDFVVKSNKGGEFMAEENKQRIADIARKTWLNAEGIEQPLLTEEEVSFLCIERGTLSTEERNTINNHMSVTIDMLESLPFPRKLRRVPEYAGGHHERMDGTGFPKGLTREQMSIPARMMAVADIFEALTSKDRPYKDPMKISQALDILGRMKDDNHIDPDIFELFVNTRVWEKYAKRELMPEQLDI